MNIPRSYLPSVLIVAATLSIATAIEAAEVGEYLGYSNCITLENETTKVVLCPESGGRVLVYSRKGQNALYLEEESTGRPRAAGQRPSMSAGRFDIGPEQTIPRHPKLWSGKWEGRITGEREAKLTSQKDEATGVQLSRNFRLAPKGSRLSCTQTIHNISRQTVEYCHWSRTFALGNGICVIPLSKQSRFPHHYVMYESGNLINFRPKDPNIRLRDGFLEITGPPKHPKLGMDSQVGWMGYLMKNDLLFVKRFRVFPDRVYNEVAALTISVWYPEDRRVELEPIGPRERLAPGESASFTEEWGLLAHKFPGDGGKTDLAALRQRIESEFPESSKAGRE